MNYPIQQAVRARKSVRTYSGGPLSQEARELLTACFPALTNPFDIPVEFRLLDAKAHRLSSPVVVGETAYIGAKIAAGPRAVVVRGDAVHFYEKASKVAVHGDWDVQRVDVGIAMAHFDLTAGQAGLSGRFAEADPGLDAPADTQYIISWQVAA